MGKWRKVQEPDCQAKGWKLYCLCKPESLKAVELCFRSVSVKDRFQDLRRAQKSPLKETLKKCLDLDSRLRNQQLSLVRRDGSRPMHWLRMRKQEK